MQMMPGEGLSIPSTIRGFSQEPNSGPNPNQNSTNLVAKKRNLPGTPDPDAEVIVLSPKLSWQQTYSMVVAVMGARALEYLATNTASSDCLLMAVGDLGG